VSGKIFLIQHDGGLVPMSEQPYDSEDLLQRLLADYPDILAGDQINSTAPRRWLPLSREIAVPDEEGGSGRWARDHLFVDQDAIPTLVEVKRSTDTRIRREVVGQLLDYAANAVVYWRPEGIRAQFEATCTRKGSDPGVELQAFLGEDGDGETFWQQVAANLQSGRVRLVFVADRIPVELQRVVEFLNAQMSQAEVLAIEVQQYVGQQLRTLVSRVVGQTAVAQQRKEPARASQSVRVWDEPTFLAELETRHGPKAVELARRIIAWAEEERLPLWWGRGRQDGSFYPMVEHSGGSAWLFGVWTYARIEIQFQYLQAVAPFTDERLRLELVARLNEIPGVAIPPDGIRRRPAFPLQALRDEAALQQFLAAFNWVVAEIRSHT
jgi:hypothetical protein